MKPIGRVGHPAPLPHVLATTSSATQLRAEAIELIDSASEKLIVASFGWAADHSVVERLCERARDGLELTVLARVREHSMPALVALAGAGARVLGFKWLHAKALWADSGRALVMSANIEKHGLDEGFELGLKLEGEQAEELRMRLEGWSNQAAWELLLKPALGEMARNVRVWYENQLHNLDVKPLIPVDLGAVKSASALDLKVSDPDPPRINGLPQPAHELECRWLVRAPVLDPKAREVLRPANGKNAKPTPYQPPVFKEPGGKLVVAVQSPEEIPSARQVAAEVEATAVVVREVARSCNLQPHSTALDRSQSRA